MQEVLFGDHVADSSGHRSDVGTTVEGAYLSFTWWVMRNDFWYSWSLFLYFSSLVFIYALSFLLGTSCVRLSDSSIGPCLLTYVLCLQSWCKSEIYSLSVNDTYHRYLQQTAILHSNARLFKRFTTGLIMVYLFKVGQISLLLWNSFYPSQCPVVLDYSWRHIKTFILMV